MTEHESPVRHHLAADPGPAVVAASLSRRLGRLFEAEDICLTTGGFAGLAVALAALVDPGEEVIFVSPPWFFYELLIGAAGAVPVRVEADPRTFDLDPVAVAAALTPRTRAVIVNSPNNPTGKIYPPETLAVLASVLDAASARSDRPIYVLSDEAYSRIVFDGRSCPSPTSYYAHSLLIYTCGKTLLTPGHPPGPGDHRLGVPERGVAACAARAGTVVDRRWASGAETGPPGDGPEAARLRGRVARRHILSPAPITARRRPRVDRVAGRAGRLRAAGKHGGDAGLP